MKTVSEITRSMLETAAERSWAESMGTDHRRAWETAPTLSTMFALSGHLATRAGHRHFLSQTLTVLGGDGSSLEVLGNALRLDEPPGRDAALAVIRGLPGMERPQRVLARLVRARVPYESLLEGLS